MYPISSFRKYICTFIASRKSAVPFFQNFQAGEVNRFLMRTPVGLGVPLQIKIWHDNSGEGSKAGWFLAKIVIVDVQTKKW